MPKTDITSLADIKQLVNTFYDRVREDDLIGPVFEKIVQDRWPEHLEKMYRFWQTVLLGEHTYYGSPFPPHSKLPIEKKHFDRWISLFSETVSELFSGDKADEAFWRAEKMAQMFQFKIDHIKNNPNKTPL
ncbi:MAG: group III truncated hemoglobin [Cryomorphaceae bacterium]|nr:MAG: group III truncated hemoglobin [Cryomorphaceae bacterium]